MSLANPTKENCHDAREPEDLCDEEGGVGHEDEEGGLQCGEVADVSKLGQKGCGATYKLNKDW